MTDHELERLLSLTEPGELRRLYDDAYQMKLKYIGKKVSIRGLIEISNICRKNCYYCGIRSGNRNVKRFQISREEIIETALWAYRHRFASLVLHSSGVTWKSSGAHVKWVVTVMICLPVALSLKSAHV